jgi:NAD(P)-dependent dehydrogenase (short-subunit alcohol dehydrogenase family)
MASPKWSLHGKTALVTGAARGIGAESARRLAARGMKVSLVGLEPEELEKVAANCGPDAVFFEADVTDVDELERAVEGTVERFGGIDVAIANAGIGGGGLFHLADPATFERTIEINLLGATRTVRACLPHVIDARGYVFVVASVAAAAHGPGMTAYAASKAGVEAFCNSLRQELAHHGVDVGVGYFSWIDTELVQGADRHPAFGFLRAKLPGPFGKTFPVSDVGDAVVDGVEARRRWIVVPGWVRALLLLRGMAFPVLEAGSKGDIPEMERRFEEDIQARGREEASAPVGAGGQAVRERQANRA